MKVLLVEDNPVLAQISRELLEGVHGHEVCLAANGTDALAQAERFCPDIVLVDLLLPDMHGYQLAARLRQLAGLKETVLVALTAFGLTGDPEKSRLAGFDAHYRKPMDFAELDGLTASRPGRQPPADRSQRGSASDGFSAPDEAGKLQGTSARKIKSHSAAGSGREQKRRDR